MDKQLIEGIMEILGIKSNQKTELIDITGKITDLIKSKNYKNGILILFSPHTTATLTINEGADPSVKEDIINYLNKLITTDFNYKHLEGNSPSHIKTTLLGPSITIIIEDGKIQLGTWQRIFFAEFDGPRSRNIWIKFISSTSI